MTISGYRHHQNLQSSTRLVEVRKRPNLEIPCNEECNRLHRELLRRNDLKLVRCKMIQSRRSCNIDGLSEQFKRLKLKVLKSGKPTLTIISQSYFGQICPSASDCVSIKVIWCQIEILLLTWCQNIPDWWNHATWWMIIPCVNIKFAFHLDWLSLNYEWFRICSPFKNRNACSRSLE